MRENSRDAASTPVDYVPCVLKLDKRKFACYVEVRVDHVPSLNPAANAVKIFSRRKKARRAALEMARLHHSKKAVRTELRT